jgi:hypothetical protein
MKTVGHFRERGDGGSNMYKILTGKSEMQISPGA